MAVISTAFMAALALALASNAAHAVAKKAKAVDILPIIVIFELTSSQKNCGQYSDEYKK